MYNEESVHYIDLGGIDLGGGGSGRAYTWCGDDEKWWILASDRSGIPRDYGPFKSLADAIEYAVNNRAEFGLYECTPY